MTISFYRRRWIADNYIVDEQPSAVYHAESIELSDKKWIKADDEMLRFDTENYVCRIGN